MTEVKLLMEHFLGKHEQHSASRPYRSTTTTPTNSGRAGAPIHHPTHGSTNTARCVRSICATRLHASPTFRKAREACRTRRADETVPQSQHHAAPARRHEVHRSLRAGEAAHVAIRVLEGQEQGGGRLRSEAWEQKG